MGIQQAMLAGRVLATTTAAQSASGVTVGGTATGRLVFLATGSTSNAGSATTAGGTFSNWLIAGVASQVELRVDVSAAGTGTFTGTLATYQAMSSDRAISYAATGFDATWTGTYTFREISTGIVLSTGNITLQAFGSP